MDISPTTVPEHATGVHGVGDAGRTAAATVADPGVTRYAARALSRRDPVELLGVSRQVAWQLPVLREGRASHRLPRTWEGVGLRLQAALWEVAARSDIPVTPGTSIGELARLLVGYGAIIPPAGDAIRALAGVVDDGCRGDTLPPAPTVAEAARVADRLAGYLALRARFG